MMNKKQTTKYLYFKLPMYPITSYFFGGISPSLKYKNTYICGTWVKKYHESGLSEAIMLRKDFTEPGKYFISLIEKNNVDFIHFLYEKYVSIIDCADSLQEILKKDFLNKKISDKEKFIHTYENIFPWVIGLGYSIDIALEDYIKEHNIDITTITIPGESLLTKEEKSLQKVARGEKDLNVHHAEFAFLKSNYTGYHKVNTSYFLERMDDIKEKVFPQVKEMRQPTNMNEWIGFFIYIRDERKRCNMIFNALYDRYIREACSKHNIPYKKAVLLTPKEFENVCNKSIKLPLYENGIRYAKTSHHGGFIDISEEEWKNIFEKVFENKENIKGISASKGRAVGRVSIILEQSDFSKVKEGDIIVASMTRPEFIPILKKANGIITNEGGVTCHAAIIARELNIPTIIGTQNATQILKDGDLVEVDADNGVVRVLEN